ncbi:MAG: TasA family protein [Methanosarcina sp.]|uniref:TasA family protein n=1 Tax=Methanosarcina sp. TaxID=2213 RepID=UPI002622B701|nr:TasA family protein [Methanosarcina sp.]MDD3248359.1 TasA family protein [Methanosarcina sp.]MDD4249018.1 TasA family protein [Methanosarcina sp.]
MKKRLSTVIYITLVILLAVSGTLAQFKSATTSQGNTLEAGKLILYMHDTDEDISTEWHMENMAPGVSEYIGGNLQLYNNGNIPADNVEILFNTQCTEKDETVSDGVIRKYIKIKYMVYTSPGNSQIKLVDGNGNPTSALKAAIPDFEDNGNGYVDLEDLDGKTIKGLPAPPVGGKKYCVFGMNTYFDESATNECQGDKCDLTLTFTMKQK